MVAPPNAHAPAGARRGGAPRRSSVSVGPAALSSGLVRPLSAAGAPAPSPRAPSLGPRLWCRLPLLGLVGLLRGVGRVAPAWGWWAVRAFAPLGFFPPPPRRRLHFWGVCRFAVGWWVPSCPPAWGAARRPRPPPLRAARWYTEGAQVGSTNERRRDRAEKLPARLGPVPCATSFATYRRQTVRFIGHLRLTFRRAYGMILSESVISLMARRCVRKRRPRLRLFGGLFLRIPPTASSAAVGGIPLPRALQKSRVTLAPRSTRKSGPGPGIFRRVDSAANVN